MKKKIQLGQIISKRDRQDRDNSQVSIVEYLEIKNTPIKDVIARTIKKTKLAYQNDSQKQPG